jgi:hypothetical protein
MKGKHIFKVVVCGLDVRIDVIACRLTHDSALLLFHSELAMDEEEAHQAMVHEEGAQRKRIVI